jgi:hypothetical protein
VYRIRRASLPGEFHKRRFSVSATIEKVLKKVEVRTSKKIEYENERLKNRATSSICKTSTHTQSEAFSKAKITDRYAVFGGYQRGAHEAHRNGEV